MEPPFQLSDEEGQRLRRRVEELTQANDTLWRELAERDRIEDQLRASELGMRLVIDGMPALVVVLSASGEIDRLNQPALDYFGRTLEDLRDASAGNLIHPHDAARVREAFVSSMALGKPFEVELRLRRFDGLYPWSLARALPLKGAEGRIDNWYVLIADIDRRKRVEDQSRAREVSARLLVESLESIPALAIVSNEVGEIVFANQQVLDYYGRTLEDVKKWPTSVHIVHPDDLEHANQVVADALRAGAPCRDEYRLQRRDGVYRWFEGRYSPVKDESGRITNWYVLLIDIDDRRRSEERLRQREAELERAHAHLTEAQRLSKTGSFTWDAKARQGAWSDEVYRIFELDPTVEMTWPQAAQFIRPDDLGAIEVAYVSRIVTARGEQKHLRVVAHRSQTERDIFFGAIQDVTETVLAEQALEAREDELRRANRFLTEAQRLSKTGSFTWDLFADEHIWSDEVYRIYGLDPDVRVTVGLLQKTIHPGDLPEVERLIAGAAESRSFDLGFRIVTPEGELKYAHVVAHRIEEITDRPVFLGALRDVTESRLVEDGLARARTELAHVARLATLNTMTASIAHEVSQPLSGILTNANTCIRMLAADPPNLSGAAETARRAIRDANRASDIVKRVRAMFSRRAPTTELVDLNDLAREVIALSAGELQRSGASLALDLAEGLPLISADRVQLQQVVLNLLMNAADAVAQVEDRRRTILVGTFLHEDGDVELHVSDSGVGLDPQSAHKMFDAFYTTKAEGMGVGLAVSRSIIEGHSGRLWATANDGPGATVGFRIPSRPPSVGG